MVSAKRLNHQMAVTETESENIIFPLQRAYTRACVCVCVLVPGLGGVCVSVCVCTRAVTPNFVIRI